jgi:hypothetical protein
MNLDDARLSCSAEQALDARNVTVDGWFIARRVVVNGEFGLTNPGGVALNLDRATLGELDATGLTVSGGQVSLVGAEVAGRLILSRAHLNDGVETPTA